MREVRAAGIEALHLATELWQRARRADARAGVWEAADLQWWWRMPRDSDETEKLFWVDDEGPVAGVWLSSWAGGRWQCDPVVVPRASGIEPDAVWARALELVEHQTAKFEVPVSDDDPIFTDLALRSGLTAADHDSTAWMDAADRPAALVPTDAFVVVDRIQPRPMHALRPPTRSCRGDR